MLDIISAIIGLLAAILAALPVFIMLKKELEKAKKKIEALKNNEHFKFRINENSTISIRIGDILKISEEKNGQFLVGINHRLLTDKKSVGEETFHNKIMRNDAYEKDLEKTFECERSNKEVFPLGHFFPWEYKTEDNRKTFIFLVMSQFVDYNKEDPRPAKAKKAYVVRALSEFYKNVYRRMTGNDKKLYSPLLGTGYGHIDLSVFEAAVLQAKTFIEYQKFESNVKFNHLEIVINENDDITKEEWGQLHNIIKILCDYHKINVSIDCKYSLDDLKTPMPISEIEARRIGVATNHQIMENGEKRFRILANDISSYIRTEAPDEKAWQKSHFHKHTNEMYLVDEGWIGFVEGRGSNTPLYIRINEGEHHVCVADTPHTIYTSKGAVFHTIKYGDAKDNDWEKFEELDEITNSLSEEEINELFNN